MEVRIFADKKPTNSYHLVPCGKCYACRYNRQQDWVTRLSYEHRYAPYSYFVTFTYEDCNIPLVSGIDRVTPTLQKSDMQKFMKRIRKGKPPNSIRYLICGEYGSKTLRPHYHGIFFCLQDMSEEFAKHWDKGFVYVGDVTSQSIAYTCKYTLKGSQFPAGATPPFALMSTKPALGYGYVDPDQLQTLDYHQTHPFIVEDGFKKRLPRFWADKMFVHGKVITKKDDLDYSLRQKRIIAFERNMKKRLNDKDKL